VDAPNLCVRGLCAAVFCGVVFTSLASAQQVPTEPSSTHIFPAGGRRGTEVDVRVGGECIPPATRFRLSGDGLSAASELGDRVFVNYAPSPRRKPSEQPVTHPSEWRSHISIAADAPLGAAIWHLNCARGGTGGRPFIVGDLPEFIETEPNSELAQAQLIEMPMTINGQIAGECDLDYFQFHADAGELIQINIVAARLGSALDAIAQIFDANGDRVAAQELRIGADPVLAFRAESAGNFSLMISGLTYRGGPSFVYRATISTAPVVTFAFPPGGQAGTTQNLDFYALSGNSQLTADSISVQIPPAIGPFWNREISSAGPVPLVSGDLPEITEVSGNDDLNSATELNWPQLVNGRLESAEDEDWYRLVCKAGVPLSIECQSSSMWSNAFPIVALTDSQGGVVISASAVQTSDRTTRLLWQPPADGIWWLRVRDLQQGIRGGPDFSYRLSVRESIADFSLTMKTDVINVIQGGRAESDITIEHLCCFTSPVELIVEGLPEGIQIEGLQVAPGQTVAKLAFVAPEDARCCDVRLKIKGKAAVGDTVIERPVRAQHLGHDPDGIAFDSASTDSVHFNVNHKPVFRLYCNEAYQYAHRGTVYPYLMELERLNGFDQPVHLEVADRQIKDLDGIEIPEITVDADQSQLMMPLYLPETMHINVQAHSNVYAQGHAEFIDRHGQKQTMLIVSTMRCMIRTLPTVVKLKTAQNTIHGSAAQTVNCGLLLDRTPNFTGSMQVELIEPPDGITAAAVTIGADEEQTELAIQVASSLKQACTLPLKIRAVGALDDDVQVISETVATLVVNEELRQALRD
jgi:hypothetical protein